MTEKLFEADSFLREFDAQVVRCQPLKEHWGVVLDRTAFYPEGGGQPGDQGILDGVPVLDTCYAEGELIHVCGAALPEGKAVHGAIDWARRFDHMQQHSGEHIVSGMICARYHCDNVGFHMGRDVVTIDFNAAIPPEDLPDIERKANAFIWTDTPIQIRYLSGEALAQAEYRSKKYIPGEVRLVAFPGADCCACCGTHVRSSGQAGPVKLLSCQKFREGVRIELLCGQRATDYFAGVEAQNAAVARALSAKPLETAAAVARMQGELEALKLRCASLQERDFDRTAKEFAGAGDVLLFQEELSSDAVRRLCDHILNGCGGRCAVFSGSGSAYQYAIGCREGDIRPLVKQLNAALSGRGGGKPGFAQGSVAAEERAIRAFFAAL